MSVLEDMGYDCEQMQDILNNHAPKYGYFGAHPGDGSDFGFWLDDSWEERFAEDGGIKVNCTSEVPKGHTGMIAQISDHGNVTLYAASRGRLREVWAIV